MKRKMKVIKHEQKTKKNKENRDNKNHIFANINENDLKKNINITQEKTTSTFKNITNFYHSKNSGFIDISLQKYGCSNFNGNGYYVIK